MYRTEEVGQYSGVSFSPAWDSTAKVVCKRFLDIVVSATAMIILSPLYLALVIAVKLSSPGRALYPWRVVGKSGRPFIGYKFRSMVANADQLKSKLEPFNEMCGPMFKITNDPRVTKVGAWMRRYSLDELPQLYSVLKGDMSLVGPRPPLVSEFARFTEYQKQKLAVKPGITCLWQVSGRNDIKDFDEWVKLDLDYIRRWTPMLDIKILVKTASEVIAGSGK
jgi:lipopolysaccharide/colanic/teichoic acid biosynthesis glycosyltransferase